MKTTVQAKKVNQGIRVKVGQSRQLAIPKTIFDALALSPGDYLEVSVQNDTLVLTPQEFVDRRIAEGLRDVREGRVSKKFASVDTLMKSLIQ